VILEAASVKRDLLDSSLNGTLCDQLSDRWQHALTLPPFASSLRIAGSSDEAETKTCDPHGENLSIDMAG
jgi:hypothetical protein